jgi:hypothetical protein
MKIEITPDQLRLIICHLKKGIDNPGNPAGLALARNAIVTLEGYLPETLEEYMSTLEGKKATGLPWA